MHPIINDLKYVCYLLMFLAALRRADDNVMVNNELGTIWKEWSMGNLGYYSGICLEMSRKPRKALVRVFGLQSEI
jgi:hypothetical protein